MYKSEQYDSTDESCKPPSPEEDLYFIDDHPSIPRQQFGSDRNYLDSRTRLNRLSQSATSPSLSYPLRASLIVPSLYLSDVYTATSPTVLSNLGITHVVTVVGASRHNYPVLQPLEVLHIQLRDNMDAKIEEYFESSSAWIQEALSDGESKVLVHCEVGASRSPTIVIAYLMAMKGMSFQTALSHVQERRGVVRPNLGFVRQLKGLERQFKDTVIKRHGLRSTIVPHDGPSF